jgi:endonuclease-8
MVASAEPVARFANSFLPPNVSESMPEGHTIHRIARDHNRWLSGQRVAVSSPQGRFEAESGQLCGKKIREVSALGKHLFYHWSPRLVTHVHLGLYGKFRVHDNPAPQPRGAVRMRLTGPQRTLDLHGPACCEIIEQEQFAKLTSRLGQDPLRPDAKPDMVWEKIARSRAAIGSLLLNQSVIAGIGNIYRAEILFLLGIHPQRTANQLSRTQFDALWELAVELLNTGVKYNRIITVPRQAIGRSPGHPKASERLNVYKRSQCPVCDEPIQSWDLGGRKVFACLKCQRR